MNGPLRVPDPSLTQMNRELTERAQDKQAAVAMRGQDLQVNQNKIGLAVSFLANTDKYGERGKAAVNAALKVCEEFFTKEDTVTDPLAGIPQEVLVQA